MIEYITDCLIQEKNIKHSIQKYDTYCIIRDRKNITLSADYGYDSENYGYTDEYGFYDEENKDFDVAGLTNSNGDEFGLRRIYTFADGAQIRSLWNAVVPIWNKRVDDYQWKRGS